MDAQSRARKGLAAYEPRISTVRTVDPRVIERARSNARRAGIGELVTFDVKDVAEPDQPAAERPVRYRNQ